MKSIWRAVIVTQLSEEWHWLYRNVNINPVAPHGQHNQNQSSRPEGAGNNKRKKKSKRICHFVFGSVQLHLTTPKSCKLSLTSKWSLQLLAGATVATERLFRDLELRDKKKKRKAGAMLEFTCYDRTPSSNETWSFFKHFIFTLNLSSNKLNWLGAR